MLKNRADVRRSLILWDHGGYDSQYMYYEVYDPFLRLYRDHPAVYGEYIDTPPYRYGRIGFPLLTKVFSAGRWQLYPMVMTWLILGAIGLCGLVLSVAARAQGGSGAWGLGVILIPGFWTSLQTSLPEPIASALVFAGCLFFLKGRLGWASAAFALSLLVRETGSFFVICLAVSLLMSRGRKTSLRFAVAAFLALVIWRIYMAWILFPDSGRQAIFSNPDDLGIPFGGFAEMWSRIWQGRYFPDTEPHIR